ncbi:aldo/keto reductase [Fervidobacterium sp. 2310opik-2]|uniref:aldo/keto reductase n=1 Tax=Fervidobacterium sp. 2310opik-2 TaxID=1755815 RepID=UPI0013E0137A|nr:aldo/keto reductase [Fervidobacterium sp. 2310opik-2]KAF2961032.1 aldo/keto reductase [Fervidobacterium sp. 2310opik-2]HOJ93951.1 aldo/keto reductase [Fervidobacterium nodosum]
MRYIKLGGEIEVPIIGLGCMRIWDKPIEDVVKLINTSLELGINFFDHADIYGGGKSEEVFAKALEHVKIPREKIIIQTKCGIRSGFYDFSKEHIISSVEKSLKRLNTDYIDILLLHRPDTLMEPEEVGEAFTYLHSRGMVRYFGVSNFNPMQIELLSTGINYKILTNQLQLSLTNTGMIDFGIFTNTKFPQSINRDGSVLEYSRIKGITIQAWSPFQWGDEQGNIRGVFLDDPKFAKLNDEINKLSQKYNVSKEAIAIAWILRHPAKIQAIVGTTNPERLKRIAQATEVWLTREEWYGLYIAAGNMIP